MATSTLGFPEMDDSDPLADVAAHQRASFDAVDAHLRLAESGQAWQTASLTNWTAIGGYANSRYRLLAGLRAVRIEFAATRNTANLTAGSTMFTLSTGFRPTTTQVISAILSTGTAVNFSIASTGVVTCSSAINIGVSAVIYGDISLD